MVPGSAEINVWDQDGTCHVSYLYNNVVAYLQPFLVTGTGIISV